MPKYRVLDLVWLDLPAGGPQLLRPFTEVKGPGDKVEQVETIVEFSGWPSVVAMEPLDDEARDNFEAVQRLKPAGQLPVTPKAWREQRALEKRERANV